MSQVVYRKSKIAAHVRNVNLVLLAMILIMVTIVTVITFNRINNRASANFIRTHSLEAADKFHSYISQDLILVKKASISKAIADWFTDEQDAGKKALAYNEMMDYATVLQGTHLYFGIQESLNEYIIGAETTLENFVPIDRLSSSRLMDFWYFDCVNSSNNYSFKIDEEKFTHTRRLWINYKITKNGETAGVFCSGLRVLDVFTKVFGSFETDSMKGFIIDKEGKIQLSSAAYGIYREESERHIHEESPDPHFTAALTAYLGRINGIFSDFSPSEVIRLTNGVHKYAVIEPIKETDWSIVVFYNSISDIKNLVPLFIIMLSALFLYVAGTTTMMHRLIYNPLNLLTEHISSDISNVDIFGKERNDEITELARTIQNATRERESQERLLHAVNKAAVILLAPMDDESFDDSLHTGMEVVARCVDVDRVHIWRNEAIDGIVYYTRQAYWLSEIGRRQKHPPMRRSYGDNPEMERIFLKNECINGPVSIRTQHEQDILVPQGIKSTLAIPLYMQGRFYGFFTFDDCRNERYFSEYEVNILRSASLMMASAIVRNEQTKKLNETYLGHKQMMQEIERRDSLLNTINNAATILFQSGIDEFVADLEQCMKMVGTAVEADRVCIWKNHIMDGKLYCNEVYEWVGKAEPQIGNIKITNVSYDDFLPGWEEQLSQGKAINMLVRTMSPQEQEKLLPQGVQSICVTPIFVRDVFWGFVSYDHCQEAKKFAENEESIMCSGSLIFAHSLLRNDLALKIRDTADKLEAVISNYQGIIWCVNRDNVITLFNGLFLVELGGSPEDFEGKTVEDALQDERLSDIRLGVQSTYTHGPQDMSTEVSGKTYRTRTTPIFGDNGKVSNIMGTFDDITEKARLQMEIQKALQEARDANQAKTKFLANMSHEMRTPLNAIIGLSELVLDDGGLHEEAYLNLEKIYNAGETLLSTVNDILDISKIEAGRFELVPVEYDTPSLINDAITQSIMRIGEKSIAFNLDISEDVPTRLFGDDLRIKQIINNLLSNAFKYTVKGTVELGIHCEIDGDSVWMTIRVSDTGKGIRSKDIANLFADYAQIDAESNRKIEGTGLGLPITKRIAEMMDGAIDVESEYGKGSVFTIKIRQKFVTDATIGKEIVKNLKDFRHSISKRDRNSRFVRIKMPYARVLVVDDVSTNLDVAKGMMKPYGMHIDCAASGQEAVEAIRNEKVRYNAIFMDHMMPGMDGVEATRIIREEIGTEYAKTIPIIALTANAIVGNEDIFLKNGFQAFVSKPIEIGRLDSVIREWVRDKTIEETMEADAGDEMGESAHTYPWLAGSHNLQKGFERFGCNKEAFLDVLHSYVDNIPHLLDSIAHVSRDDLESYGVTVHGIKGASRGIGADAVGNKAEALERAAKARDFDYVYANNLAFLEAVEQLISGISTILDTLSVNNPRPQKDQPDREMLQKLLAACERYDMDGMDEAMEEIERFTYASDDGLAVWLRENLDLMNLMEIRNKLLHMV